MKYSKLTLSFLFLFSITIYSQDYNQTKKNIVKSIENHEDEIIKISDKIWELAETAFNEHESSKLLSDYACLLYTSPSPRDGLLSRMPSSA